MSPTLPVLLRLLFIAPVLAGTLTEHAFAYPQINSDGTVEFTYHAAGAARVTVSGDMGSAPLAARGMDMVSDTGAACARALPLQLLCGYVRAPDQDNLNVVTGYGPGSPMSYFEVPGG